VLPWNALVAVETRGAILAIGNACIASLSEVVGKGEGLALGLTTDDILDGRPRIDQLGVHVGAVLALRAGFNIGAFEAGGGTVSTKLVARHTILRVVASDANQLACVLDEIVEWITAVAEGVSCARRALNRAVRAFPVRIRVHVAWALIHAAV